MATRATGSCARRRGSFQIQVRLNQTVLCDYDRVPGAVRDGVNLWSITMDAWLKGAGMCSATTVRGKKKEKKRGTVGQHACWSTKTSATGIEFESETRRRRRPARVSRIRLGNRNSCSLSSCVSSVHDLILYPEGPGKICAGRSGSRFRKNHLVRHGIRRWSSLAYHVCL